MLTDENKLEHLNYCISHVNITQESLDKYRAEEDNANAPPNSPDLNVLDLGFFASIQTLQYKM
ncbi:hypothetical protein H310_14676, partial [Aphanomyces invadans]